MAAHILIDLAILAVVACGLLFWHDLPNWSLWAGCAAVILFVVAITFFIHNSLLNDPLQNEHHAKTDAGQGDDGNNGNGPSDDRITRSNLDSAKVQEDAKSNNRNDASEREQKRIHGVDVSGLANLLMAVFTLLLVICSAVGFVFQTHAIRAARDAADATLDYAKTTDQMMHRQLRAYLLVDSANIMGSPNGGTKVRVTLKNSGQTPVYKLTQRTQGITRESPYTGPFTFKELNTPPSKVPLAPGGFFFCDVNFTADEMTDQHKKAITDKLLEIWVYGEVIYFDTFGMKHSTTFRLVRGGQYGADGTEFKASADGNEAD